MSVPMFLAVAYVIDMALLALQVYFIVTTGSPFSWASAVFITGMAVCILALMNKARWG